MDVGDYGHPDGGLNRGGDWDRPHERDEHGRMEGYDMAVENTSNREPVVHLAGMLAEGQSGYIEGMEAAGQRAVVNSDLLPRCDREEDEAALVALGFTFGEPIEGDDLFRHATLPAGWKRAGSDHNMWSYIEDERGIRRVAIFYKAAFYDRKADCHLVNVGYEAVSEWLYSDTPIPLDALTEDERAQVIVALQQMAENDPKFYDDKPERAKAMLLHIGGHEMENK